MIANWKGISAQISDSVGERFVAENISAVAGGCINNAYVLSEKDKKYFIKANSAHYLPMFEAEFDGLNEIRATNTVTVPEPFCYGSLDGTAFLVMQHLELTGACDHQAAVKLGEDLAHLHRQTQPQFGWYRNNTIGSTPQVNTWHVSWADFWRDQRLGYQLQLAATNGFGGQLQKKGERLMANLATYMTHSPAASLLHGDLWSGNYSILASGQPVIFDPAVYYGDREADIAMTELFGRFPADFYSAYTDSYPLDDGYKTRKTLYNLYHILNHLNLFGGSYLGQAKSMMDRLLSEV